MNSHSPGTSGNLFIKNLFKLLLTQVFYQPIESQRQAREYIFTGYELSQRANHGPRQAEPTQDHPVQNEEPWPSHTFATPI